MTKEEEIEQLKDELDALHMTYLSQVYLYKSLYNHLKEKIDSFNDEKIEQLVNDAVGSLDNSYKIFYKQAINEVLNQLKNVK